MRRRAGILLAVLAVTAAGCASVQPSRIQTLTTRTYPAAYDRVWDLLIGTLHDQKELIADESPDDGVVTTEWVVRKRAWLAFWKAPSQRYRYRIRLQEADGDRTRVSVRVDFEDYQGDGIWGGAHPSDKRAKRFLRNFEHKGYLRPLQHY